MIVFIPDGELPELAEILEGERAGEWLSRLGRFAEERIHRLGVFPDTPTSGRVTEYLSGLVKEQPGFLWVHVWFALPIEWKGPTLYDAVVRYDDRRDTFDLYGERAQAMDEHYRGLLLHSWHDNVPLNRSIGTLRLSCGHCGAPSDFTLRQESGESAELLARIECGDCGAREQGRVLSRIHSARGVFLKQEGVWQVAVPRLEKPQLNSFLRELKDARGLSTPECGWVKQNLPGPVAEGTRLEMEFLHARLSRAGIPAEVVRKA